MGGPWCLVPVQLQCNINAGIKPGDSCDTSAPARPGFRLITGCGQASVAAEKRRSWGWGQRRRRQTDTTVTVWPVQRGYRQVQSNILSSTCPVLLRQQIGRQQSRREVIIFHHLSFVFTTSSLSPSTSISVKK